ncbi:unnamed protein product [Owenia fusiformis]|uniref:Uncharacterized protein n=1 Tax=Owenia fusiformis TaxID=6347 RepID=A0A8J1Y0U4_OWEFU|nr:unnamed protein product [Owenia fusiformis]
MKASKFIVLVVLIQLTKDASSSWVVISGACLPGFNNKIIEDIESLARCKRKCEIQTTFICRSVEYSESNEKCILSTEHSGTQSISNPCGVSSYDYAERSLTDPTTQLTTQNVVTTVPTTQPTTQKEGTTEPTTQTTTQNEMTTVLTTQPTTQNDATTEPTTQTTTQNEMTTVLTTQPTTQNEGTTEPTTQPTTQNEVTTEPTTQPTTQNVVTTVPTTLSTTQNEGTTDLTTKTTAKSDVTTALTTKQTTQNEVTTTTSPKHRPLFINEIIKAKLESEVYKPPKKKEHVPVEAKYAAVVGVPPCMIIIISVGLFILSDLPTIFRDIRRGCRNENWKWHADIIIFGSTKYALPVTASPTVFGEAWAQSFMALVALVKSYQGKKLPRFKVS